MIPTAALEQLHKLSGISLDRSTTAVTIESLPPEIIRQCLKLAVDAEHWHDSDSQWLTRKTTYPFLLSASLVSRQFSHEARSLLWQRVLLRHELSAQALLRSPALGQYPVLRLEFSGKIAYETGYQVVRVVKVFEKLVISVSDEGWQYQILESENLKDINHLTIRNAALHGPAPSLPFALKELTLWGYTSTNPTPFSLFSSSTITVLQVDDVFKDNSRNESDFPLLFESVASQLDFFGFDDPSRTHIGILPGIIPLFSRCASISQVYLDCTVEQLKSILVLTPSQLKLITWLRDTPPPTLEPLLTTLRSTSLSALRGFRFGRFRLEGFKEIDGGQEFIDGLRAKGVEIQ